MNTFIQAFGGVNANTGAARALTPQTRLLCGVVVFAICSATPLTDWRGGALFVGTGLVWATCCGLTAQRLAAVLKYALILFIPLLLFALPARWADESASWQEALRPSATLCVRGIMGIIITAATLSTFTLTTFAHGVAALPLPRIVASLLVQLAHQTFLLANETRRMVDALKVRGVTATTNITLRLRILTALPIFWLTRIANRATRVGDAMEVRGFDGLPHGAPHDPLTLRDALAHTLTLLTLATALTLRWMETR